MKKLSLLITALFIGCLAYANGVRLISLAEVPSSKRPWQVFLSADYAQEHLKQASRVTDIFGE